MKKKILATVLAAMVAFSVPMSASAAWRKDSAGNWQWWENGKKQIGWKYIYQSGYNTNGYFTTMGEYYFNSSGNMVTGWQFISNKWYYFGADGKMKTDWQFIDGSWYYLKAGIMYTGWLKDEAYRDDSDWYYLLSDGRMAKGWQTIGGRRYYFYSNGKMAKEAVVDGYLIDSSGEIVTNEVSDNDTKEYTSIDDLIDKWNYEYRVVDTPFGVIKLSFDYYENTSTMVEEDYRIYTGWEGFSPYDVKYSNQYTDEQKDEMKKILKTIQENLAKDVAKYLPDKKVRGGYHTGFYRYPHLQVGYTSTTFLNWVNYKEVSVTSPNFSIDHIYQNAKVDRLHWIKYMDDYDFH